VNRTVSVLNHLVTLGLVERRDVGPSALVRLARENEAVRSILELSRLRDAVLARIGSEATAIEPVPLSVVVFGSMARGEAREESDIDVVVVRSRHVEADDASWTESLGRWSDKTQAIAGSPVNLLVVAEQDVPNLLRRRNSVWREIVRDGITLVGSNLQEIGASAS
jgi:predicted nucleotidyltransferase